MEEPHVGTGRATTPDGRGMRRRWERRYEHKQGRDFGWYLDRPPDELVELVEGPQAPHGGALDLGCGPGVATAYLARHFQPAIGFDIAHGAAIQARDRASQEGVHPSFLVAEAPILPFRSGSFGLLFDRGCLQAIPRDAWTTYFSEATRLLTPGGILQLFASKPVKRFAPITTYRGVRSRLRWLMGRRGAQFLSHDLLEQLAAPSLEVLSMKDFQVRLPTGLPRLMTVAVFRKREPGA